MTSRDHEFIARVIFKLPVEYKHEVANAFADALKGTVSNGRFNRLAFFRACFFRVEEPVTKLRLPGHW